MKNVLLGISLVLLIILLLLPPSLRWFASDLYKDNEEKPKDVVTVLNCVKDDETINTTYFNDNPYNYQYTVIGNILENDNDNNLIIQNIKRYASPSYDEISNITTYQMVLSSVEISVESLKNYTYSPEDQESYYQSIGFTCTMRTV